MRFDWKKQGRLALLWGAGLFSFSAIAGPTVPALINADGTVDTEYRAGDKTAGDDQAIWIDTPSPTATEGVAVNYDLRQDCIDPESAPVTLSNLVCDTALPTGVSLSSPNIVFTTGTSAGTTTGCSADCEDGTTAAVTSLDFSIVISAAPVGITVDGDGGADFTTIQAAANAAVCGDTILVRNVTGGGGSYNEGVVTTRNCTSGNEIVIQADAGHAPVWTKSGGGLHLTYNHTGWDIGAGIHLQGTNPYTQGAPSSGNNIVVINTANNIFRGKTTKAGNIAVDIKAGGDNTIIADADIQGCGSADDGSNGDGGNCVFPRDGINGFLLVNTRVSEGGHSLYQFFQDDNFRFENVLFTNDWVHAFGWTGTIGVGNRAGSVNSKDGGISTNYAWRGVLINRTHRAVDAPTQAAKLNGFDLSISRTIVLDHKAGGSVYSIASGGGNQSAFGDIFIDHETVFGSSDEYIFRNDNGGSSAGRLWIKNVILTNIQGGDVIQFNYCSTQGGARGNWRQSLFVDGVIIDANKTVDVNDTCGSGDVTNNILWFEANESGNFSNITVVNPNFVSTTLPTSTVPATALSQARANFLPQAVEALGTGSPLTTVVGAQSNDTVIELPADQAGWFRDDDNNGSFPDWADFVDGDTITLCGATREVVGYNLTTDTITLNSGVTCSGGEGIYRGSDATPNMGAVL